jgi:hypothetical protein
VNYVSWRPCPVAAQLRRIFGIRKVKKTRPGDKVGRVQDEAEGLDMQHHVLGLNEIERSGRADNETETTMDLYPR